LVGVMVCGLLLVSICAFAGDDPQIGDKPLSELAKQLRSDNRGLQLRAAKALTNAPVELKPIIMPKVLPLLKSERENDKFVAAQVLGECGPVARTAVPDLLPMLEGTHFERNRAAAAKALGQIPKDSLDLLEKMRTYQSHPHAEIPKEKHDILHKEAEIAIAKVKGDSPAEDKK
jgi:HEAT repeat protein